jgi:hypothetical protein
MTTTSSSPTWDEYLDEAVVFLTAVRKTAEMGVAAPTPPERPEGPFPEERRGDVEGLIRGFDQLAIEVATRLVAIEQRRPVASGKNPHSDHPAARYVDAPL